MVHESVISLTTAVIRPFDPGVLGFEADYAQVELNGTAAKYWKGGSSPTVTIGFTMPQGSTFLFERFQEIKEFRICASSGSGTLTIYARN